MSAFVQPLDLQSILVNHLSGTVEIFMYLGLIVIAMLAGKFRMSNMPVIIMFMLFVTMFSAYFEGLYFAMLLGAGMIIFYGIGRVIKY